MSHGAYALVGERDSIKSEVYSISCGKWEGEGRCRVWEGVVSNSRGDFTEGWATTDVRTVATRGQALPGYCTRATHLTPAVTL